MLIVTLKKKKKKFCYGTRANYLSFIASVISSMKFNKINIAKLSEIFKILKDYFILLVNMFQI